MTKTRKSGVPGFDQLRDRIRRAVIRQTRTALAPYEAVACDLGGSPQPVRARRRRSKRSSARSTPP